MNPVPTRLVSVRIPSLSSLKSLCAVSSEILNICCLMLSGRCRMRVGESWRKLTSRVACACFEHPHRNICSYKWQLNISTGALDVELRISLRHSQKFDHICAVISSFTDVAAKATLFWTPMSDLVREKIDSVLDLPDAKDTISGQPW
jgi:hypothetical protein